YYPGYYGHPCCGSVSGNVYGHWGNAAYSGTRPLYKQSRGAYGTSASGHYTNYATGTTGTYSGNRSYNPYSGQAKANTDRTFNTPYGASGVDSRTAKANPYTGKGSYAGSANVSGPAGGSAQANRSGQVTLTCRNSSS